MRRSIARRIELLLALALAGVIVIFAQLVSPTPAYCSQTLYGIEDGGDPDGLDFIASISDKSGQFLTPLEVQDHGGPCTLVDVAEGRYVGSAKDDPNGVSTRTCQYLFLKALLIMRFCVGL